MSKENRTTDKSGSADTNFTGWLRKALKRSVVREWMLVIVVFFTIVGILQIDLVPKSYNIIVGEQSRYDIVAPRTIINRLKTEERQEQEAAKAVNEARESPEYKMISLQAGTDAAKNVTSFFEVVEKVRAGLPVGFHALTPAEKGRTLQEFREKIREINPGESQLTDNGIIALLTIEGTELERIRKSTRQVLVALVSEMRIGPNDLVQVREKVAQFVQRFPVLADDRELIVSIVRDLLFQNLVDDDAKLRQVDAEARKSAKPILVVKGQPILMKGDMVTSEQKRLLEDLNLIGNKGNRLKVYGALALFSLLLMGIGLFYLLLFKTKYLRQERLLYMLGLIALLVLVIAKFLTLPKIPGLYYLIPVVLSSILLTVLLDSEMAWVFTVLLSMFVAVIAGYDLSLAIYYILSGSAAIYSVSRMANWSQLLRTTIIVAVVNFFSILTLGLLFGEHDFLTILGFGLLGMLNALLSTVFANGLLPFMEHLFGLTSFLSLLEMANPSHPLLKRLLVEAPGTYHHSIIVGNLAEAAAEAIGADKLLVRVGSYYHDIGKIRRPYFFVENQIGEENPHEKLNPNLSTLIIISHVKDGTEMAKEYSLPEAIRDIIEQHHGTDLIRYFFHRASEIYQEEKETVVEADFRYPGPKPQTREAALVMLADSVEAAARSMTKSTPAKIEGLVKKIIQERMEANQFDDCNLTFRDLDRVKQAFLKVLGGIFHHRIEYPEAVIKEMERKKLNAGGSPQ
jgi:putative nucleotidyltransferase with HDIG domain